MDPQPTAPPVVAVLVAHDPGPWFEESLAGFAAQDYPNLSVLVIDAASATDLTPRVAAVLPSAYVRRVDANRGYGACANEVLEIVEGASHFLFSHDDAAPDPDAVRFLVEESYRSNAAVVAPKFVAWDDPDVLLSVGQSADVTGVPVSFVEPGELDQEQHDAVRDVFVAPGGFTLVRTDLFETLGGFDGNITFFGEDLDLSWRAQIAGARVVVAPSARVRHREAMARGERVVPGAGPAGAEEAHRDSIRPLQLRHRLRATLKNYRPLMLTTVLVRLAVINAVEVVYGTLTGHRRTASAIVNAWRWNLGQLSELRPLRHKVQEGRALPDREVHNLQTAGSARFRAFLRGQLSTAGPARVIAGAADALESLRRSEARFVLAVYAVVALVVALGSRELIAGEVPAIREFAPLPDSPTRLLTEFFSGWRSSGLGSEAPAPPAFALLAAAGYLLLGSMGLLRTLLVLGPVLVGLVGAARLAAPFASSRARLAAVIAYAAVPLAYNAVAAGSLGGVVSYALAPWLIGRLARSARLAPFPPDAALASFLRLALMVAFAVALAPSSASAFVVAVVGLAFAVVLTGRVVAAGRVLLAGLAGAAGALVLLFPWSFELLPPGTGWSILGAGPAGASAPSLLDVALFRVGPVGAGLLTAGLLGATLFGLIVGNDWRYLWAVRCVVVAAVSWGLAWGVGRGLIPVATPDLMPLLAPAAIAVALALAAGVAAFENDLRGFDFGGRQLLAFVAAVAAAVGSLPVLGAAFDGRWYAPERDYAQLLSWMRDVRDDGAFRVLWLGSPEVLPLDGWELSEGVSYGTSRDGPPQVTDRLAPAEGRSGLLADAVSVARRGETARLGRLLAPMGVRYIAVPSDLAPGARRVRRAPPAELLETLRSQIDLREVATDEAISVYENAAWVPARAVLTEAAADASEASGAEAYRAGGAAGVPALRGRRTASTSYRGEVPGDSVVHVAESSSARWRLEVEGEAQPRRTSYGWANAFRVEDGGPAVLAFRTPISRWLAIAVEIALVAAASKLSRFRRREAEGRA